MIKKLDSLRLTRRLKKAPSAQIFSFLLMQATKHRENQSIRGLTLTQVNHAQSMEMKNLIN